ncbi:MAG TPA: DUF5695 domain-containing protein [Candidatus Polarisedimenticolia bacterium]|nr:DUF5695 domain-containing protein [Candidatus Polarisedimenticolia bacterium]
MMKISRHQLPCMRWFWILSGLLAITTVGMAQETKGEITRGDFHLTFDERGITGLANPHDPFGAQILPMGQRLGLTVRFRTGEGEWQTLPAGKLEDASAPESKVVYASDASEKLLRATQTFSTDGSAFDWNIELESASNAPVEIGDLSISIPAAGPRGENPTQIFEHGFLRHQFISGNGSFLYFVRASGTPPFLIVTVKPGTKLEYFGAGFGRGGAQVFVHSGLTAGKETRGTWRQPNTFLKLGPAGAENGKVHYGFRFRWAKSYDEMRDILFQEGLFDIRAVPGMTIPNDLTAKFSLHTKARIESIEPEFPAETKITALGQPQRDTHVYEVAFKKLGENRLTIHHDGGRKTYLEYFVTEPLETLIKKRAAFIIDRQQIRDPSKWWDGVFGPYDMKNKVVRTIDDPDIFVGRMVYTLTCDDPGLSKAPYVAEKNVSFPDKKEIEGLEYYLEHFVWGKLQRTDKETPYPYGVYGTPNWWVDRDATRRREWGLGSQKNPNGTSSEILASGAKILQARLAQTNSPALRDLGKEHVFRSYDYPHVIMLYFHMYEIAKKYPAMSKYLDAPGYLERAYQTAHAFFTYPYEIYPSYYETYKWGLYNELVVLKLADALDREGFPDRAAWLRSEWEKKVKYFVYDDRYPFRSEYAFDRTAFESSYAFAKYGATHDMQPDTNLWHDVRLNKDYSHPSVKRQDSRAFMERQLAAGLSVRGWLETSYYQLGSDPGLSYMAAMGGWGILDYALNFSDRPTGWLQLGYASYLSSWCLVNSGPPESNYGFWFPGKENDGAAGWQFTSSKVGSAWMGSSWPGGVMEPRGPWHYDGEIDLGFGGALRMAATVLTRDPIFNWFAYGGTLAVEKNNLAIVPRDGLRQRFDAVIPDENYPDAAPLRLKIKLDRDGFAAEKKIVTDKSLNKITFTLENRTGDAHTTGLWLSLPAGTSCTVLQDGRKITLKPTANWDYPLLAELKVSSQPGTIQIIREAKR